MVNALDLLHKYAVTFRKMIQVKVLGGKISVKRLLKLNSDSDFDFLIAAMDIIDDASAAISHVERFGLSGATKYDDFGERYLRLYGLLSATYIQQQSMLTIYRLMNLPNSKKMKAMLDDLQIRKLRHKLSAHSTDYLNTKTGGKEAYVPLRFDLGDRNVTAVRHSQPMEHEKVNLSDAIESHLRCVIEMMDLIVAKANKTLFKGQDKKQKEFAEELDDLRTEKSGGLVFKGPRGGPKIVVTFVGSQQA
jgi:hypothetical protein